jgi:hypothetical protein
MAIQSQTTARARSDAVVGALIVAIVAILAAGLFTVLQGQSATTSIAPEAIPAADVEAVQRALIDVRAGERSSGLVSVPDAMSSIRAAEKESLVTPTDVRNALVDVRAGERVPLGTSADLERTLILIRAGEREGR